VLEGIWIFSNQTKTIPLYFSEDPVSTPPTKQVYIGWNAIGFSDITPLAAHSTLMSVDPDWTQIIGFDADNQRYQTSIIHGDTGIHSDSKEMMPAQGYWLYMMNSRELPAVSA
jgi:hypothetical protein